VHGASIARVTSYPRHLLGKDGEWRARFAPPQQADPTDEHAHTRQYLESFLSAARNLEDEHCYDEPDPALPEQFFAKLRKKGESGAAPCTRSGVGVAGPRRVRTQVAGWQSQPRAGVVAARRRLCASYERADTVVHAWLAGWLRCLPAPPPPVPVPRDCGRSPST
jgi:hypothetical protein